MAQSLNINIPPYTRYTRVVIASFLSVFPLLDDRLNDELFINVSSISSDSGDSHRQHRRSTRLAKKRQRSSTTTGLDTNNDVTTSDEISSSESTYRPSSRARVSSASSLENAGPNASVILDPKTIDRLYRLVQGHRHGHAKNEQLSVTPTTTIISCGTIENVNLITTSVAGHDVEIEKIDSIRKIWAITYRKRMFTFVILCFMNVCSIECDIILEMFYGRQLTLRLEPLTIKNRKPMRNKSQARFIPVFLFQRI